MQLHLTVGKHNKGIRMMWMFFLSPTLLYSCIPEPGSRDISPALHPFWGCIDLWMMPWPLLGSWEGGMGVTIPKKLPGEHPWMR